ncbi:hypothetical protein E2493_15575 [Sphingomonas parva]|uniref:Uncharacterized protein n=1 Tax=Sphingomonas parva TaxID=2555898 RepID=A0A4Y8ZMR9_9SPHN|nr:hypothetical protein [Sphingomonas parva]TFI57290.1 hypothetical protein E2493_15575 [Sphingomonas parva]
MKKSLIALVLLAGCGGSGPERGNDAAPLANGAAPHGQAEGRAQATAGDAAGPGRLTGLYESGAGEQKNQLCIVDKGSGSAQFGLIVRGANNHNCAGAGTAVRSGARLTLTMTGDSTCSIEARMDGGTIKLPAGLPAGCSYYCGAQARMANASFERSGSGTEAAMKAKDLAGDALCEGAGG